MCQQRKDSLVVEIICGKFFPFVTCTPPVFSPVLLERKLKPFFNVDLAALSSELTEVSTVISVGVWIIFSEV